MRKQRGSWLAARDSQATQAVSGEHHTSRSHGDICLILEGTYPYVSGGVSTWTHELLHEQKELRFHLVCILAPDTEPTLKFTLPDNVLSINNLFLQRMPAGVSTLPARQTVNLFQKLEGPLLALQYKPSLDALRALIEAIRMPEKQVGSALLLNSFDAWKMLLRMYRSTIGTSAFLDYFWSWRALMSSVYSVALAPLPHADVYHALCTGYAGLMLARARIETGRPCLLTEHGIYTNERRIEIASADWLESPRALDLNITVEEKGHNLVSRDLQDLWIDMFVGFSRMGYEACEHIITLYEGNTQFQIEDGANPEKLSVIPNGIDYSRFAAIPRNAGHPPTVALIGRVVPIKDILTFLHACRLLKDNVQGLRAYVMGPTDEDKGYYEECRELVRSLKLQGIVEFTGKVQLDEYLGRVDLLVLTSISEAQPLVILEAGAAGIPSITTDVGACREMLYGRSDENPPLGHGGIVCPLSNAAAIAEAAHRLLADRVLYRQYSEVIRKRVETYYNKKRQHEAYRQLYESCRRMQSSPSLFARDTQLQSPVNPKQRMTA